MMTTREKILAEYSNVMHNKCLKITDRLKFIKILLEETNISPLIDLSVCDHTEYFHENFNKNTYDFTEIISSIGGKLRYIKSGSTGHTFQAEYHPTNNKSDHCIHYAVKVVGYPIDKIYAEIDNKTRPENAELLMLKTLSQFVITNQTPHIVLPLAAFNSYIDPFIALQKKKLVNNKHYDNFVHMHDSKKLHNVVSVLISEWADCGDLLEHLRKNLQNISVKEWRVMLFQIFSVFAVIQKKYPTFKHNDAKANNFLRQMINEENGTIYFGYEFDGIKFHVPNIGYQLKLWDFDFACISGIVENDKVNSEWTNEMNISNKANKYYDICFFMASLQCAGFLQGFRNEGNVPSVVLDFFDSIVPQKLMKSSLINERGRLLADIEYTTPLEVITTHPFFNKLRAADKRLPEDSFKPSGATMLNEALKTPLANKKKK